MSNDLISRSALISHIESERRQYGEEYDIELILGDIEDAPTAYDVDKVVEQLEEAKEKIASEDYCRNMNEKESCLHKDCYKCCAEHLIEIVKGGGVEQYNNGWIPVEEELPETDKYILLSFSNFSIPCVGRYEEDENGGAFYVGDDETCVSQDMFVNAWMNLPAPYQPKGE